ncbi:MAG: proline--tRNA ligase [Phycisphaerales bacterium]|jgi:prolyl-tRNA synthetase|nr:proline--tRNA ligase [Phycisphaerales bacterium]
MRYSKLLIPTTREVPADAEIPSHRLMIRAGYVRKVASGTYTYLVLGLRSLRKIMQIVREEMDASGAQEILMPVVQPLELWDRTGRSVDYGETLATFTDRHGRGNALAPTAEEVCTHLASQELKSYKQLPVNLYQIGTKVRDEFRPRFGALRSREFIMKDAYSFHTTPECLDVTYRAMYDAYKRIFERCGVPYVIVEAESGEMGGSGSDQFTVPCENGEDVIVHTEDNQYAANIEKAQVDPPAETAARGTEASEEISTPGVGSIEAVCGFLKTKPAEMIKTLVYKADEDTVICLIRGDHELNPEKLTQAAGGAHIEPADEATVRELTGASVGFAGPIGMAGKVAKVYVDPWVAAMCCGITGANKTDCHVKNVVPGRDFPLEGDNVSVIDIRNAAEGDTFGGKALLFHRGIEVGQVFKLGTKYSKKLDACVNDESGASVPCIMGCYGIGINRILASAIEVDNDKNGCIMPIAIAPFEVEVVALNTEKEEVFSKAEQIYTELQAAGVDVLLDDRDARPGVKFKDADLIGIPLRIVVGERGLAEGNVEIKLRTDDKPTGVPFEQAVETILAMVKELKTVG